ncbi:hypothetical protein VitviT2T_020241 [Vitis vinifera]|uniref:Uncharacterized protein n=1 Tax=Vitis vinifera TaxID=29760 RepID=A0ABY9D316_VITVI|nr:hypothetical protein VitviT2T_020241 [Vitis vinifera]
MTHDSAPPLRAELFSFEDVLSSFWNQMHTMKQFVAEREASSSAASVSQVHWMHDGWPPRGPALSLMVSV